MTEKNLWGDLSDTEDEITPANYLVEQAKLLTLKTKGVLQGAVETGPTYGGFRSELSVVVPSLNNYQYELLTMKYGIGPNQYPVTIREAVSGQEYKCTSPEQISDTLRGILSSQAIHKILGALRAQTRAST